MGKQGRARNANVAGRLLDRDGRIPQREEARGVEGKGFHKPAVVVAARGQEGEGRGMKVVIMNSFVHLGGGGRQEGGGWMDLLYLVLEYFLGAWSMEPWRLEHEGGCLFQSWHGGGLGL
jgi:hypothetical protein